MITTKNSVHFFSLRFLQNQPSISVQEYKKQSKPQQLQIKTLKTTCMSSQNKWIQKLNQFKKLEKSFPLHYTILKSLNEAIQEDGNIALQQIFQTLLKSLPKQLKQLTLYKQLIYAIWMQDSYPIKVKEECSHQILRTVTQWIMEFEVKIDGVNTVTEKFRLIRQYMQKNCFSMETSLLIIDEIFQDLKDLFDKSFWSLPQQNIEKHSQYTFLVQADPEAPQQIINLLQLLVFRQIESVENIKSEKMIGEQNSNVVLYLSTYSRFASQKYYVFILKCLNYMLCLELNQSYQSQITMLALQFIRNKYCLENPILIINLVKRLILRTQKAVRYALVGEYIQTYEFFHILNCDQIIEQLEDIIYFRQLIIGHSKVSKKRLTNNLEQNLAHQYFSEVFVKAGSKERVFFSVQDCSTAILKIQLFLEEGMDINMKIFNLNNGSKQIMYHEQPKTQLRKLDLKIKYTGLYAIQFDNSYSWIHGKKILYNLHVMKKIQNLQQIIGIHQQSVEHQQPSSC